MTHLPDSGRVEEVAEARRALPLNVLVEHEVLAAPEALVLLELGGCGCHYVFAVAGRSLFRERDRQRDKDD